MLERFFGAGPAHFGDGHLHKIIFGSGKAQVDNLNLQAIHPVERLKQVQRGGDGLPFFIGEENVCNVEFGREE